VSISQVLDVSLRLAVEAVVALSTVALPILPFAVCDSEDSEQEDAELADEVDGVANRVFGGVFKGIGPSPTVSASVVRNSSLCSAHTM